MIKGFAGSRMTGVKIGTLLWKWLDDQGMEHSFKIPNSYYVPSEGVRLLSPQHWANNQVKGKRKKVAETGTLSQTTSEEVKLFWNDRRSCLTVPLSRGSNVATFYLAPGYDRYNQFCMNAEIDSTDYYQNPILSDDPKVKNHLVIPTTKQ